jgi:hypothetical protein
MLKNTVRLLSLFGARHHMLGFLDSKNKKNQCRDKFLKEEETAAEHDGVVVWCLYLRKRFQSSMDM